VHEKVTLAEVLEPMVAEALALIELGRELTSPLHDATSEAMGERLQDAP
jgi:hypothetical protein